MGPLLNRETGSRLQASAKRRTAARAPARSCGVLSGCPTAAREPAGGRGAQRPRERQAGVGVGGEGPGRARKEGSGRRRHRR